MTPKSKTLLGNIRGRNMAELMVDRMKDEIVDLKEQNDELLEEQR